MALDGLQADREDIGNLLVSMSFRDQFEDGFLARRKNVIGGGAALPQKLSEQRLRYPRGEEGLVLRQCLDRRDDGSFRVRLQQISEGPGLEHAPDQNLLVVHRENEDFSMRLSLSDLPRRLDSIQERERVVDDGHVRLCF
jgi:hypothetical protein